jgi:hypothetical protein
MWGPADSQLGSKNREHSKSDAAAVKLCSATLHALIRSAGREYLEQVLFSRVISAVDCHDAIHQRCLFGTMLMLAEGDACWSSRPVIGGSSGLGG